MFLVSGWWMVLSWGVVGWLSLRGLGSWCLVSGFVLVCCGWGGLGCFGG